jgi:hypothetical protein
LQAGKAKPAIGMIGHKNRLLIAEIEAVRSKSNSIEYSLVLVNQKETTVEGLGESAIVVGFGSHRDGAAQLFVSYDKFFVGVSKGILPGVPLNLGKDKLRFLAMKPDYEHDPGPYG